MITPISSDSVSAPSLEEAQHIIALRDQEIRELHQRMALMQKSYEKAEVANKNKSAFLANMSHEVRTPLAAILGFSEFLSEDHLSAIEQKHFIDIIRRNGKSLTKIIDDLLDLSKVEAGSLKLEPTEFSFPDLIQEVNYLFQEQVRTKQLSYVCHTLKSFPHKIISDSGRIRQILVNLIGNAIKFTETGGVTLSGQHKLINERQIEVEFKVQDTGIGLTEEQKKRLFVPYVQADSTTSRRFGGTGLGLALSKQLALALQGDIVIENIPDGVGSCFKLTFRADLPLMPAVPHGFVEFPVEGPPPIQLAPLNKPPGLAATVLPILTGAKVLLVEDSEDNQFLLGRLLKKHGADFQLAIDGEQALERALQESFDLILMDIQIPKMNGYEVTRRLRSQGFSRPIVALTAHAMESERLKSIEAGCNLHLTKPLDIHKLLSALENLLKSKWLKT